MRTLAVIPARGGSMGLPGKNIRPLGGLPLIGHSIRCAAMSKVISRTVVSTDSAEISAVAVELGGEVPFVRPNALAQADTPMMPVLQHALGEIERQEGRVYDALVLLDPTSPARWPAEIDEAVAMLARRPDVAGVVAVSKPTFNPFWVGVTRNAEGVIARALSVGGYVRRQDVPEFLRINGSLYVWRTDFLRGTGSQWLDAAPHAAFELPERRAFSIDDLYEFELAELMIRHGLITLPWMKEPNP